MKKSALLIIIAMFMGVMAKTQFSVGPKIGLNLNKFAIDYKDQSYEPDTKYKFGFQIGAMAKYQVSKSFAIRTGLLLINKGTAYKGFPNRDTITGGGDTITGEVTITNGYMRDAIYNLEIPLDFVFSIGIGDDRLLIHAGPYIAIALGGKRKWDYDYSINFFNATSETGHYNGDKKIKTKNAVDDEDLKEDYNVIRPFDYGFNFGLGYRLYSFEYNIQYGLGLSNLFTDYAGSDPKYADFNRNDWKQSNRMIAFGVTYFIKLSK